MNTTFEQCATRTDEWHTPPDIIRALGHFDLDPCAPSRDFYTADVCYTKEDDGLAQEWFGRVWCNPPYNRHDVEPFIKKMARHANGIALLFNRMDTAVWHDVIFPTADALLIMRGRIGFMRPDGTQAPKGGCGSVFVCWGGVNVTALENSQINGKLIKLK
ncbi:MAG: phage N-6-adenine-methyltransferase [Muribaculaceae bacterium]|nr:phage N-6-adenine-methyltransferase [Muribaculaceae bacterium]